MEILDQILAYDALIVVVSILLLTGFGLHKAESDYLKGK